MAHSPWLLLALLTNLTKFFTQVFFSKHFYLVLFTLNSPVPLLYGLWHTFSSPFQWLIVFRTYTVLTTVTQCLSELHRVLRLLLQFVADIRNPCPYTGTWGKASLQHTKNKDLIETLNGMNRINWVRQLSTTSPLSCAFLSKIHACYTTSHIIQEIKNFIPFQTKGSFFFKSAFIVFILPLYSSWSLLP